MIKIYSVVKTEPVCNDYAVKINGMYADTNTARVSAAPINRRWPGHQRDVSQSEPVQFISLAADEPVYFEITPNLPFDPGNIKIRPRSLNITPDVSDGTIRFTLSKPAYFTVEAYGRNKALHVFVDKISEYNLDISDSNVIYFGVGEHDVGHIRLNSGQTLFIDEGAVVYARVDALDAENIKILGNGILDNSRNKEEILFEASVEDNEAQVNNAKRVSAVQFEYCANILVDGITIRDSLMYNIRPLACDGLEIRNVKIIGCWRYNSDGIDMHNCTNVHIDNCFIRTYDDCICAKGFDCFYDGDVAKAVEEAMYRNGKAYDVFKNLLVENCVLWNDWGKCLEIGAETRADEMFDIKFRNCEVIHVVGSVLDCMNVDYADVHDVSYENIYIETDEVIPSPMYQRKETDVYVNSDSSYCPNIINNHIVFHHEYSVGGDRRGKNRQFTYKNIFVYGNHPVKFRFSGYDENHKVENIRISDVYLNDERLTEITEENMVVEAFAENIIFE